ncbi:MAG: NUDIX domain-containing protein [Candidatus Competibacteraceae bacterium]
MTCKPTLLTLTTAIVLFTIHTERLEVLLAQRESDCGLPGGGIEPNEDLDTAARRHLAEQTGWRDLYLEQLYTFSQPGCDPVHRVVTVAYYALIPAEYLRTRALQPAGVHWVAVPELPSLRLDYGEIVALAHRRLAAKLAYSTIALQLMPERFTLSELQAVYETILGEPLDKRNFRKRVLALDCIEATGERARRGGYRPAQLYRAKRPGQIDFIK